MTSKDLNYSKTENSYEAESFFNKEKNDYLLMNFPFV